MHDPLVHIIGAGPAGSIAAISAVRHGYDTILSEEHPIAGVPTHCSGLFSKDGLERLRDFVDYRPLIINPIYGAILDIAGVRLDIVRNEPVAFVCDRAGLDQTLAANAVNEGVHVAYGKKAVAPYASSLVIGADGPFSSVARHFGFPKIEKYASTLQAHIPYPCEDPHRVEVYIDTEKFPGFFAWIIPQNEGVAEFGVGVTLPHSVTRAWRALLTMKGVSYPTTPKGAVIPIRTRKKTAGLFGKYRVCLVGDAAGQTKSNTGGGVIFGGQCAMLAGKYAQEPWKYETMWKLKHGPDLLLHQLVHRYWADRKNIELCRIATTLKSLRLDQYLSQHGHMDRPLRMIGLNLVSHFLSLPFAGRSRV